MTAKPIKPTKATTAAALTAVLAASVATSSCFAGDPYDTYHPEAIVDPSASDAALDPYPYDPTAAYSDAGDPLPGTLVRCIRDPTTDIEQCHVREYLGTASTDLSIEAVAWQAAARIEKIEADSRSTIAAIKRDLAGFIRDCADKSTDAGGAASVSMAADGFPQILPTDHCLELADDLLRGWAP
jgi:hypothetical protein